MGMSILWGLLFSYAIDLLKQSSWHNLFPRFKNYIGLTMIISIVFLLMLNFLQTNTYINGMYEYFNRSRHEQLWNLISPYFLPLVKDPSKKFIYVEGDLSPKELGMINSVFPYQLYVSYERSAPFSDHSFIFLNKREALDLLKGDSFNINNFVALRINNGKIENIKDFLIQETKNEN